MNYKNGNIFFSFMYDDAFRIVLDYRIRGNRTPAFYLFLRVLGWRTTQILPNFTLKKCHFGQKSGVLFKMAF